MDLLDRFNRWRRVRRAQQLVRALRGWHKACQELAEACWRVLNDAQAASGESLNWLDEVERSLMRLRDHESEMVGILRRRERRLVRPVRRLTEDIIRLRNSTMRFVIRAQGPTPRFMRSEPPNPTEMRHYYEQAMDQVGDDARVSCLRVRRELKDLWAQLQPVLREAEREGQK
jgi:hypothetical protein